MTAISTSELRNAVNLLLAHLEEHGVNVVEIADDFYWDVSQDMRYDKYEQPKQLNIGQLSDDINEVKRLVSGDAPAIGFGLVWVSAVLRRVGEISPI